jgi:RimJ/RimL family protein N-acetyltransferase
VIGDGRQTSNHLAFTGTQNLRKNHGRNGTGYSLMVTARSQRQAPNTRFRQPSAIWDAAPMAAFTDLGVHVDLPTLTLPGPRLTLRPWQIGDAEAVHTSLQDRHLHTFLNLPDPYTREQARAYVGGRGDEGRADGTGLGCAVVETASGRLVGSAALRLPVSKHSTSADIGYWINSVGRGKGYAAEASRTLAEWGFGHGIVRVEIRCAVGNLASARSAMNAGFRFEGVLRGEGHTPSGPTDHAVFGRLSGDAGEAIRPVLPALPEGGLTDGVVTLRVLAPSDAEALAEELNDPESMRWQFTETPTSLARARELAGRADLDWLVGPTARLTIVDAASAEPAGSLMLRTIGPPQVGGVGYGLRAGYRGRGYTARALRLLSDWAFTSADFARLELGAKRDNIASQKVAVAGGFEPDGVRDARLRNPDGSFSDEVRFVRLSPRVSR